MSALAADGLRATIDAACAATGGGLGAMTVLAAQNDPFRVDTPSGHRDGESLAVQAAELGLGDRVVHLRGLHYMLVSGEVVKPDGTPYTNTDRDWFWLVNSPAKAARWLGYLPFEQVKDARSSPPVIRYRESLWTRPYLNVGLDVEIPDPSEMEPRIDVADFRGTQPFKLVLFGEKTSLEEVLIPIADWCDADLYLPAGEISDTFLYTMAKTGARDGRPMVVFTISDCDPAGWQMPVSIGRKLQAFAALQFPELEFQVQRVALHPDHVREHGLPSTPLKDTEKRADRWVKSMGVEQTEIDALASLAPDLLDTNVRRAIKPFFDTSLERRVREAKRAWIDEAQVRLDEQLDPAELDRITKDAATKLEQLEAEINALNDALAIDIGEIDLPEIVIPQPELNGHANGEPLVDSRWPWVEQTTRLKASKDYAP